MTVREAIALARKLKPCDQGVFDDAMLVQFVNEIEGKTQTEVLQIARADCVRYDAAADLDAELLIGPPHDKLYYLYVMAMIDFANAEYDKYNNTVTLCDEAVSEWARWFIRTHGRGRLVEDGVYLSAYGIAVKHGYTGTEEEWTALYTNAVAGADAAAGTANAAAARAEAAAESLPQYVEAAQAAQTGAESARDGAQAAQTAAETAKAGAEAAKAGAETAKSGAAAAKAGAETAQAAAETAKAGAEAAQAGAETAQAAAETSASESAASAAAAEASKNEAEALVGSSGEVIRLKYESAEPKLRTSDGGDAAPDVWQALRVPAGQALLPDVTTGDNGKFLRVVSGSWAAAEISQANGVSF